VERIARRSFPIRWWVLPRFGVVELLTKPPALLRNEGWGTRSYFSIFKSGGVRLPSGGNCKTAA